MSAEPDAVSPPAILPGAGAVTEHAPMPMATVDGATRIVRYGNPAFCRMMGRTLDQLVGRPFDELLPEKDHCVSLIQRVFRTGKSASYTEQEPANPHPVFWSYTMWPVAEREGLVGVMIQVTETAEVHSATVAMNEALLLGSIRQHELTEAAENLNAKLLAEVSARAQIASELSEKARLIDLSNDAIIVRDLNDRIRLWNKGAEKLFGWTFEEVKGKNLHSLMHTEFSKPLSEIIAELHREGRFNGEVVQRARDGRRVHSLCGWVMDEETGSIFTSYTDITERTRAVEALRSSESRYRTLFDSIDEGFCVMEMIFDEQEHPVDYRFLELNPAFEKQTGLLQAKGKRVRELVPDLEADWFEIYGKIALTGEPVRFVKEAVGLGDRWFDVYACRIGGVESRKVAAVFNDITERRMTDEDLAEKARLLDLSHDAIIVRDMEGCIRYWNHGATELYGWTREEALGQLSHVLLQTEFTLPLEEMIEELHRTGRWVGELVHTKRDGRRINVLVRKTLDRDAEGNSEGVVENITDITERRELSNALADRMADLARADRSKDEFLAMLAHELRNPLTPLRNAAEILQAAGASGDERVEAQRIIGRQIENMSRMIDDLLDVSRITEGKIEMRKKTVSLDDILTDCVSLARSGCAARDQDLTLTLSQQPVFIDADATRLEQVFGNLLTNACRYAGEGRHITVSEQLHGPEVIVTVSDDGAGIEPEFLPRIFDLFVQASRTLDRTHGGLGIGLTLVKRLVHLHGGTIEARSEGPGRGAQFIVRLPVAAGPAPVPAPVATPPPSDIPLRILIVDDNIDSARSLAILQTRRGHITQTAFTGPSAVTAAAEFLPEVVLLDIGLPGMDGFAVARQLRSMPALQGVFIIAISGYGEGHNLKAAKAAGFDEYMVKPIDLAQLRAWLAVRGPAPRVPP